MTTNPSGHDFSPPTGGNFELHERVRETIGKIAAQRIFFRLENMPEEQRNLRMGELAKWFDGVFPRAVARVPNYAAVEYVPDATPNAQPATVTDMVTHEQIDTFLESDRSDTEPLQSLEELLAEVVDEQTARGFLGLIDHSQYSEGLQDGTTLVGMLIDNYMGTTEQAREFVGDELFSTVDYRAVLQLGERTTSGKEIDRSLKSQTLSMIKFYNRDVDEQNVISYLSLMIETERQTQQDNESEKTKDVTVSPAEPIAANPEKPAEKKRQPHLWDIITRKVEVGADDFRLAADQMLKDAHDRGQLSTAHKFLITSRLFEDENSKILSPEDAAFFHRLEAALSSLEGKPSRIYEVPDAIGFFKKFVHYSHHEGAATLTEMTKEANRKSRGGKIHRSTIVRKTLGVMQVVFEDTYNG